jgi:crossover junction endodeoxyribonuclease RusA
MILNLPWPPSLLNPNRKTHWAVKSKAAKSYKEACFYITKQENIVIDWDGDIHLWIDFYPPDKRHRDDDNVISSFKSGRDGIADALGVNDRRFRIHPFLQDNVLGMVKVRITEGPRQG